MTTKQKSNEPRYFIVRRDELGAYGNENGSTQAEAEALLTEAADGDLGYLVVIKGVIVPQYIKLERE